MNIFILDRNPIVAAQYHCDKHVVKMVMESAQLMSTAHHYLDGTRMAEKRIVGILRPTHESHPCAKWVRQTMWHYQWVHTLMGGLLHQYTLRYGRLHAYEDVWEALRLQPRNLPVFTQCGRSMVPPPQCMPDEYKLEDKEHDWDRVVLAYRRYYFFAKPKLMNWSYPAEQPEWYIGMFNHYTRESL